MLMIIFHPPMVIWNQSKTLLFSCKTDNFTELNKGHRVKGMT